MGGVKIGRRVADDEDAPLRMRRTVHLVACSACHAQFDAAGLDVASFACSCGARVEVTERIPIDAAIRCCASCGAGVVHDAPACTYCGALIERHATRGLVCPECYSRNVDAAAFCAACGVAFRPQQVPSAGEALACPVCEQDLVLRRIGEITVRECGTCRGLWVPGGHFDRIVDATVARRRPSPSNGLCAPSARVGETSGPVSYRRCPDCGQVMYRKNFGSRSGVIVDWCKAHGTWLDADELGHIASFIAEGGLTHTEQPDREIVREADRLLREARRSQREPSLADFLLRIIT